MSDELTKLAGIARERVGWLKSNGYQFNQVSPGVHEIIDPIEEIVVGAFESQPIRRRQKEGVILVKYDIKVGGFPGNRKFSFDATQVERVLIFEEELRSKGMPFAYSLGQNFQQVYLMLDHRNCLSLDNVGDILELARVRNKYPQNRNPGPRE